jgi:hypothetical protein
MIRPNSSRATIEPPGRKRSRVSKKSKIVGTQNNTTEKSSSTAKGRLIHHAGSDLEDVEADILSFSHDEDEEVVVNASLDLGALDLRTCFDSSVTELPLITSLGRPCPPQPSLAGCNALELFLLKYCKSNYALRYYRLLTILLVGDEIAPELVAIDDQRNGWRYLALPIARSDRLVMRSVLAAAAFHFTTNVSKSLVCPVTIYQSAIAELRHRQDISSYLNPGQQIIMLSLLTLLATSMVSGSADFRIILHMIEAAWNAAGGEASFGTDELGVFIKRQYRK